MFPLNIINRVINKGTNPSLLFKIFKKHLLSYFPLKYIYIYKDICITQSISALDNYKHITCSFPD